MGKALKLSLGLKVGVEITQASITELAASEESIKQPTRSSKLFDDVDKEIKATDDLYLETAEKLAKILKTAVERINKDRLILDLQNPFNQKEMQQISKLALENWSGSISIFDMPEFCLVQVEIPENL